MCKSIEVRPVISIQIVVFYRRLEYSTTATSSLSASLLVTSANEYQRQHVFVCLLVSRITQKLFNRLLQNSVERWHSDIGHEDTVRFPW